MTSRYTLSPRRLVRRVAKGARALRPDSFAGKEIRSVLPEHGGSHDEHPCPLYRSARHDSREVRRGVAPHEASGEYPPDGLEYHVAFTSGGSFRVSEVWDSKEQFEAFGQRLMPILTEGGVELSGPPELIEIHNIIKR